jgi:Subunit CCDC53 of WASH complex
LPLDAVKHSVKRDGKDPAIMDLDPEKSIKSQMKDSADDGPPLKEDPEYEKYFKMLKMGLPMGAVKNAVQRDGKDPSIMDLDPNKSIKSQIGGGEQADNGPPLKEDPEYEKVSCYIILSTSLCFVLTTSSSTLKC